MMNEATLLAQIEDLQAMAKVESKTFMSTVKGQTWNDIARAKAAAMKGGRKKGCVTWNSPALKKCVSCGNPSKEDFCEFCLKEE